MTDPLTPGELKTIAGLKNILARRAQMTEVEFTDAMSEHVTASIDNGLIENKPGTINRCMASVFGVLDETKLKART